MKHETIEAVLTEMARLQGQELNGHDRVKVRTHIASALAAQEQYSQRMGSAPYRWKKPENLRR
ncbi:MULTISPECIES: hypothetical protein [Enterobacter cloacae complex]|uniref:hypothetical protein n=1 Tax=Enterobacter cloacae complex TaxID=354276 RepID=UPI000E2E5F26|nr:hypothetical protein [Enterobacter cloacae]HAV2209596.1 hypothetical protein [Enterobacter cloacae]HAV2238533.1 hypothetical protein [Enterobacter cloacae]